MVPVFESPCLYTRIHAHWHTQIHPHAFMFHLLSLAVGPQYFVRQVLNKPWHHIHRFMHFRQQLSLRKAFAATIRTSRRTFDHLRDLLPTYVLWENSPIKIACFSLYVSPSHGAITMLSEYRVPVYCFSCMLRESCLIRTSTVLFTYRPSPVGFNL